MFGVDENVVENKNGGHSTAEKSPKEKGNGCCLQSSV